MAMRVGVIVALLIGCRSPSESERKAPIARTVPANVVSDAGADSSMVPVDSASDIGSAYIAQPGPVTLPTAQAPLTADQQLSAWLAIADGGAIVHVASFYASPVDGPPFATTQIFFAVDASVFGSPLATTTIEGGHLPTGDVIAPHSPHFEENTQYLLLSKGAAIVAVCPLIDAQTINVYGEHVSTSHLGELVTAAGKTQ